MQFWFIYDDDIQNNICNRLHTFIVADNNRNDRPDRKLRGYPHPLEQTIVLQLQPDPRLPGGLRQHLHPLLHARGRSEELRASA